jgi:hypothetical protein
MPGFADRLMVRYLDPTAVNELLVPAADGARTRARALLESVYVAQTLTSRRLTRSSSRTRATRCRLRRTGWGGEPGWPT